MRAEEFQTVANAVRLQNVCDGAHAAHVPVEVFVERARSGGPHVIVGVADAELLGPGRVQRERLERRVKRAVVQLPAAKIGGHGHQAEGNAVFPENGGGLLRGVRVLEQGARRADRRDAVPPAQRREHARVVGDVQHGSVERFCKHTNPSFPDGRRPSRSQKISCFEYSRRGPRCLPRFAWKISRLNAGFPVRRLFRAFKACAGAHDAGIRRRSL